MLVKSLTDDLAWQVQRDLVNCYFRLNEVAINLNNKVEIKLEQFEETLINASAVFSSMIQYATINYQQQQELLSLAKDRVNHLLGGAHSVRYKEYSRIYFKNLWLNFCNMFQCGSYKDLNPLYMDTAKDYLSDWNYA